VTDHEISLAAARELRTSLAAANLSGPFIPRELREAVPRVVVVLQAFEDSLDRIALLERGLRLLQREGSQHREQTEPLDRNVPVPDARLQAHRGGEEISA
jgi:hypothetical protein